MSGSVPLSEDIVIDEEAFDTAVNEFNGLLSKWQALREMTENMLADLEKGFQTPAGRKFLKACRTNLFAPLDDQKKVLEHVASSLQESKQAYASVFSEYESLIHLINQSNH